MAKMAWLAVEEEEKSLVVPQAELWHYHVTCVCQSFAISPVVTPYRESAISAFHNMIILVTLQTGLEVVEYSQEKAIFSDGSTVRYFVCMENCLQDKEISQQ